MTSDCPTPNLPEAYAGLMPNNNSTLASQDLCTNLPPTTDDHLARSCPLMPMPCAGTTLKQPNWQLWRFYIETKAQTTAELCPTTNLHHQPAGIMKHQARWKAKGTQYKKSSSTPTTQNPAHKCLTPPKPAQPPSLPSPTPHHSLSAF